jgi:hypothetical protein
MKIKKITFITYHNWDTKRHGGFHQFARYTCEQGIETVFFSFSRPYYIIFKKEERLNYKIFRLLTKGYRYNICGNDLLNVTWPTFALPGFLRKFVPSFINKWLMCHSLCSFNKFSNKWLRNTDCFVFESCDAVFLLPLIKKYFPNAQIIYRPSDPLVEFSNEEYIIPIEKQLIETANKILLVNEESIAGYKDYFPDIYDESKSYVVSNGVSLSEYLQKYDCPKELQNKKTALYIGSFNVDWKLIKRAALQLPDIHFIIITPHKLNKKNAQSIKSLSNILYIPGINSSLVPIWVTNANLIMQPFHEKIQHYNKKSLSLTAKNYKAMAAGKPIVTYKIPMHLSKYGLVTTDSYQSFIDAIDANISKENVKYDIDIEEKNWDYLCPLFLKILEK